MKSADSFQALESQAEAYGDADRLDMGGLLHAIRMRWVRIALVTLVVTGLVGAALMFVPKTYESSASLLVEQRDNSYTGSAAQSGSAVSMDALMSSQIELIKSRDLLLEVEKSQGLESIPEFATPTPSPVGMLLSLLGRPPAPRSVEETVLTNLADRMTVIRERDSAVISIFVRSSNPELAASLANAIAAAHVKRRAQQSASDAAEATVWLQQEIDRLRLKVQQADTAVANFKVKNNLFTGSNATPVADQQLSTVTQQISDAQQRKNTAEARAITIRQMLAGGQSLDSIADVRESPSYQRLLDSRSALQADLAQKSTTLLSNHPTIKALKAQIRDLNAQLLDEGRKVADSLEAEANVEAALVKRLTADLGNARTNVGDATKGGVTLDSLDREAKAQRDLLESYLAKYSDALSRSADNAVLPDVRIVSEAAPSADPASPKVTFLVGVVAFVTAVLQVGGVVFGELLAGRTIADRPFDEEDEDREAHASDPAETVKIVTPREQKARVEPLAAVPSESAPEPAEPVRGRAFLASDLAGIASRVEAGDIAAILLVGLDETADRAAVAGHFVDLALAAGRSVATVEAGRPSASAEPGISDLSLDHADYGEVVHQFDEQLAVVPWGTGTRLDWRSPKPLILAEALADIYELVLLDVGPVGMSCNLPIFAGFKGEVLLVADASADAASLSRARRDIARLGFEVAGVIVPDRGLAAVA